MAYIETIATLLRTNEMGVLIIFLFGYLSLRYILDKDIKELHEIDKIIFGISIGVICFIILREIFIVFFEYINLIFYSKNTLDYLINTSNYYIILIFSFISLSLIFKELHSMLSHNTQFNLVFKELYTFINTNKSNNYKIKRLQKPLTYSLIIFIIISLLSFIISLFSYFTIQTIISFKLLKMSLVFSIVTSIIYYYYCISHGNTINKDLSSKFKQIKNNKLTKKRIIIILGIISLLFFIFPKIEYSPEINTNYVYDIESSWLNHEQINQKDVYYYEEIEQNFSIKRVGLLGWIPIENKDLLTNPSLNIILKSKSEPIHTDITNKSFDNDLNSFIIEFNKLYISDIESIILSGSKKINLDKSSLNISIDVDTPNKIKLNITNHLDKPIHLLDAKIIKSLNTDLTCSLSQDRFKAYYNYTEIQTSQPSTNDYNTSIQLISDTVDNYKNNNINFQIKESENYIYLSFFTINPNTTLEAIININCK